MGRRYVLFGSGDWASWSDPLFTAVAGDGGHAAVLAAGQAYNGDVAVASYRDGARQRLARVGIDTVDVPILTAEDADDPTASQALQGASLLYVLGGGPNSTIRALRSSRFWVDYLASSISYVGSSGGAMMLGSHYPPSRPEVEEALGVFPDLVIAAHWNALDDQLVNCFVAMAAGQTLLTIDEDTIDGDGRHWRVHGTGKVNLQTKDGAVCVFGEGAQFEL